MATRTKEPGTGLSDIAPDTNGVVRERGPNGVFLPGVLKSVILEGVTLDGVYAELQTAYRSPVASHEPVSLSRWRKLFMKSPAEFLRILKAEEDRWRGSQDAAVKHNTEFDTRGKRITELEAENTVLKTKIAEIEARLPEEVDPYDDPGAERVLELGKRLLREYGLKVSEE